MGQSCARIEEEKSVLQARDDDILLAGRIAWKRTVAVEENRVHHSPEYNESEILI